MHAGSPSYNVLHFLLNTNLENLESHKTSCLVSLRAEVFGFQHLKDLYLLWRPYKEGNARKGFHLHDDFLF